MRTSAETALEEWHTCFLRQQEAAAAAMRAAFPPLTNTPAPTGCCDTRLEFTTPGLGHGSVCVDQQGQSTVQFSGLPHALAGEAFDAIFGLGWFDDAPEGIAEAGPGSYQWDDDSTGAEYVVTVGDDGTADLNIEFVPVPDLVAVLDAPTRAQGAPAAPATD